MRPRKPPRHQGRISSWKDEQGFGFITPHGGGPEVFVHIKSIGGGAVRPVGNEVVTYDLSVNGRGQSRAENVAFVDARSTRPRAPRTGTRPLLAAGALLVMICFAVVLGRLPFLVLALYLGASAATFVAYALDKSAARHERRRISENTLHLLAVIGGWPGALLAQLLLRHKSSKESFRALFWVTVVLNCCVLLWMLSASGAAVFQSLTGG